MSKESELQKALDLMNQGKRSESRAILLSLEPQIKDAHHRLLLIDASLSVLDPVHDNLKKVALSVEGASLAEAAGLVDLKAHFEARTADLLMLQVGLCHHESAKLKLSPEWIEFATEAEKTRYESLTKEMEELNAKIDNLLSRAIFQAEKSGNKKILGYVLMSKGDVVSSRYMQFKADHMRGFRAKFWSRFELMRYPFFEYLLTFSNGDARTLNAYVKTFTRDFLKAAKLLEEINDPSAGAAYQNLANHLRTAYRFSEAKKYVAKGKAIATKHNDALLMRQLEMMERSIATKNRDIPDYINGETRDLDSL